MEVLRIFDAISFGLFAMVLCIIFKYQMVKYKQKRITKNMRGPKDYPIIGSTALFLFCKNTAEILNKIGKLFEECDPVGRFWFINELIVCVRKPEFAKIVLNHPKCLNKAKLYKVGKALGGDGVFFADVSTWKPHRKLIGSMFTPTNLRNFSEVFAEQSVILVDQLMKFVGKGDFDVFHNVVACTLDSICETAMGVKIHSQTRKTHYNEQFDYCMRMMVIRAVNPLLRPNFIFRLTKMGRQYYRYTKELNGFAYKIVTEKRKQIQSDKFKLKSKPQKLNENGKMRSMLSILTEDDACESKLNDIELRDEMITLTIAGSDTSASTLSFVLIVLGMYPDVQKRVYEEIIQVVGPERRANYEDLHRLDYTERVIKETLRIFPVPPFLARKSLDYVDLGEGYVIPPNCTIFIAVLDIHRSEKYWKQPMTFDPDRFLPKEIAKVHPYAFLPFSGGPRNCVGTKYGMLSMKSMIVEILRKFVITTPYKRIEDVKLQVNLVTRPRDGYKIRLEHRT